MTYAKEFNSIFGFIDKILPQRLLTDQKNLRIVSEGDLQSCVYYHLRKFFEKKKFFKKKNFTKWHILNKLSMGDRKSAKQYPDIVIVWMNEKKPKKNSAVILIELKESIKFKEDTAKDEIEKLQQMLESYNADSGFFLYACRDKGEGRKVKQTNKIMEEMIPNDWKRYLTAKTINIKGKRTYDADMQYFDEKIEILRKYRG